LRKSTGIFLCYENRSLEVPHRAGGKYSGAENINSR
jgi:hypothetical protein